MLLAILAPLLLAATQEPPAFERVDPARAFPRPSPERVAGGYRYEREGERLLRSRGGPPEHVPCLPGESTGDLRALEHHPAGTTWVAAERGLFCTSPETGVLDRLELADGAPLGGLVGLARVAEGRLWLATGEAFGCIDAAQRFGRTFGAEDGLPPPPYRALAAAADGSLFLAAADGVHRYRPDRGPAPTVRLVAVDGHAPAGTVTVGVEGAFELELEGTALGGPSFRYRAAHHHQWRALAGPRAHFEGLEPGEHELHFAAFDRDLRRSAPAVLRVRVPYPPQYSKALLPPLVGGAALLVVALSLARARGRGRRALGEAAVSGALVVVVGLQVLAGLIPHGRGWPLVGYAMYTDVHREGEPVYRLSLYALRAGGRRQLLRPWGAGEGQMTIEREFAPLLHGRTEERRATLQRFAARFSAGGPLEGLLLLDERLRLTAAGPVQVAPIVMCVVPEGALDAAR